MSQPALSLYRLQRARGVAAFTAYRLACAYARTLAKRSNPAS
jgi:hypothetical protein